MANGLGLVLLGVGAALTVLSFNLLLGILGGVIAVIGVLIIKGDER